VLRSPDTYLKDVENLENPQLGDSHLLKWGPLPIYEVGKIVQQVGKGDGRKK
jgi:hypothetical protein